MRDPIAYEFAPPLPGYPELASVKLSRDIERYEANAQARAEMARASRLTLSLILAASVALFAWSASVGLGRAERAHQQEARV